MKQSKGMDMTVGNPLKLLFFFSIPILIGNVFQQLYNIVDTAVIGHVLGDEALAAIGATTTIYSLIIGFAYGITNGFSVVLGRFYGKKDDEAFGKAVNWTMVLSLLISFFLTIISLIGMKPLLVFLSTPEEIIDEAAGYLQVVFVFSMITMLYNMFANMLRAIGNSYMPLAFLVVSTVLNIILDIIFVKYMGLGINGAGFATVIAQFVSLVLSVVYIYRKCPILKIHRKYFIWDKEMVAELFTTGLSMGLMYAIVSIGSVALQSAVNGFGTDIIAAHTSARKIDSIFMQPLSTISLSTATFVSQNYGAGKWDRVKQGIKNATILAFIWSGISTVIVMFGSDILVEAITGTKQEVILNTASMYIKINIPFFFLLSVLLNLRCSLQGVGRKLVPLMASTVELVAKFVAVGFIAPALGYFGVCILEPLIWVICMTMVGIDYVRFIRKKEV